MASFFSKYPKLIYNTKTVTDIITRIALREKYSNKVQLYYNYDLQDGDTPEIVAAKYYNDPERHWIVMMMNEIIDPVFDFPLSYVDFLNYLDKKYETEGLAVNRSGSEYAKITLNPDPSAYRVVITTTDNSTGIVTENKFFIDEKAYLGTYDNSSFNYPDYTTTIGNMTYNQTKEIVYIFDYEQELNESKRTIKLLRAEYAQQFEKELKTLMSLKYV